jgi:hypothetical protein
MLKRVYWVSDRRTDIVTAGVGFREHEDAPYERSVEKWEKENGEWVYKGTQTPSRQQQLESHPDIHPLLS